jgi:sugar phosphate isomerase/epimerase
MPEQPKPELTVAYWTIAGIFPGVPPEHSPFDFKQRVEAAARAGFRGMGIWHTDLDHILERRSLKEMKEILDDNGMKFVEVEFLTDWFMDGELRKQSDVRRRRLLTAAEGLGAAQVKVGDFYQRSCPMPQLIEAFAGLCADAAEHGTRIVFEPMAVSMINRPSDCLAMLEGAGADNGGIMFDLWHVANLGISYEEIARWPGQYLFGAEVDDGTFKPGEHQPIVNRNFCGEGEFDIKGFVRAVNKAGYFGPWGVEIFSEKLLDRPLEELAGRSFSTAMNQF